MSWFGTEFDGPMIVTRTVHFAASAAMAGALIFRGVVAEPALRAAPPACALVPTGRALAWIRLAVTVVSGLTWVLLLTMSLSGESLGEAVISGALRDVLNLTQFGLVSQIRLALAIVLAICLAFERSALWRRLALIAAVSLVASIAWTGHAASTPDKLGYLHLASDALHLTAASAWVGGLLPLSLLLGAARRRKDWASFELDAVQRFSNLGIASVATLILSGFVNAWILRSVRSAGWS
jgi:putative copper resistance protein D